MADPASPYRVAIVQYPPIFLDRRATLDRAVTLIHEATDNGAQLVAFSETFVSGYPELIGLVQYRIESAFIDMISTHSCSARASSHPASLSCATHLHRQQHRSYASVGP
jgi:predicted amidohydrolase